MIFDRLLMFPSAVAGCWRSLGYIYIYIYIYVHVSEQSMFQLMRWGNRQPPWTLRGRLEPPYSILMICCIHICPCAGTHLSWGIDALIVNKNVSGMYPCLWIRGSRGESPDRAGLPFGSKVMSQALTWAGHAWMCPSHFYLAQYQRSNALNGTTICWGPRCSRKHNLDPQFIQCVPSKSTRVLSRTVLSHVVSHM